MADEQIFNIPLRSEFQKVPTWNKAKKAVKATRQFLIKHMKVENVLIGKYLHEKLMLHGRQNPPHHVKVRVWKDGEKVKADLVDAPREEKKPEAEAKGVGKKIVEKITEAVKPKAEEHVEAEAKEKKDVLEHEKVEHKEKHALIEGKPEDKRVMETERHKNIRSHGQKPTHEKKK